MTTIRFDDNRGGLAYPFLPADKAWQITARSLGDETALAEIFQADTPTLRWVKDDKVLDLHVPGMDTAVFLAHTGLKLSLDKGGYVLSKRLSRIMRPFRYWGFFADSDITIDYNPHLDGRLWDGSGQVSRGFIQRLADTLPLDERHRQELLSSGRFEVTTLHSGGQDKGHVLVVDDLAVDFMFPTGSAKQELRLANPSGDSGQASRTFIGLHPVHSDDQMCLDIQSLINLYPFFQPEQLLVWAEMESALFLDGIRSGRLERLLNRLPDMASLPDDAKDLGRRRQRLGRRRQRLGRRRLGRRQSFGRCRPGRSGRRARRLARWRVHRQRRPPHVVCRDGQSGRPAAPQPAGQPGEQTAPARPRRALLPLPGSRRPPPSTVRSCRTGPRQRHRLGQRRRLAGDHRRRVGRLRRRRRGVGLPV